MFTSGVNSGYPALLDVNIYPGVIESSQICDVLTIRPSPDVLTSQKRQRNVKNGRGLHQP